MTPDEIIKQCDLNIKTMGANARIHLILPGTLGQPLARRLCEGGPMGEAYTETAGGKRLLVVFSAAEVKTYLEEKEHGNITGRIRS
jgi:hypothetical protein